MPPKTAEKTAAAETKPAEINKVQAARHRDLDAVISTITKTYGEGSIMRLGDARAKLKIDVIPTARWQSIWHWASAVCRVDASWRFLGRSLPAKPP